ncbi:MAG: hypothetical protein MZV64_12675 [Ignavibacteriales bacterium]|nr:hypothetical protein [Ignavibacteriales bacterium]
MSARRRPGSSGRSGAPALVKAWQLCDAAVRGFPVDHALRRQQLGLPLVPAPRPAFRPGHRARSRRPSAPITRSIMTVTFNNPNLVDLGTDILWTLMTREQADAAVAQADQRDVEAPRRGRSASLKEGGPAGLRAARARSSSTSSTGSGPCAATSGPCATRRPGWPESTVTYEAKDPAEKDKRPGHGAGHGRRRGRGTPATWPRSSKPRRRGSCPSTRRARPSTCTGRTSPSSSRRKVALMEKHRDDEPRIDPDFMWRLPSGAGLDPKIYLKYRP